MKIGFNMLLWTTHVTKEHLPILETLKKVGYDGVEIPKENSRATAGSASTSVPIPGRA